MGQPRVMAPFYHSLRGLFYLLFNMQLDTKAAASCHLWGCRTSGFAAWDGHGGQNQGGRGSKDSWVNTHLKLGFEDVIAEPASSHSFDKVWICSHALFELSRYVLYKLLTLFLAIPLALVAGIVFAVLSCLHIWIVMPFVKTCLMVLPSVQTVWKSMTDVLIAPVFQSLGRCFATANIRLDQE